MAEALVDNYNNVRLHSAIGYVAPADKLAGRENEIFETAIASSKARAQRARRRQAACTNAA